MLFHANMNRHKVALVLILLVKKNAVFDCLSFSLVSVLLDVVLFMITEVF